MAAFLKSKLKSAREAISKKDWTAAQDAAKQVLSFEASNYNALVFLGLASLELGQHDESEQAYQKAIALAPEQNLAWQGLCKFYERFEQWDKLKETLDGLTRLYQKQEDAQKCAETIQRRIQLERQHGTKSSLLTALSLVLPNSPFFPILSSLPEPDPQQAHSNAAHDVTVAVHNSLPIIEEMVEILEKQESDQVTKEVERRRMRLTSSGQSKEQLTNEVGRDIWASSQLPGLYDEIINHANTSDELRRLVEAKLLRYKYRYLQAIPSTPESVQLKADVRTEVDRMTKGVVLLDIPDELAWHLVIDAYNVEIPGKYDVQTLIRFKNIFPTSPLALVIQGYFRLIGFSEVTDEKKENVEETQEDEDDPLDLLLEGMSNLKNSIFAHRVLADLYLDREEYQDAINTAETGLNIVSQTEKDLGVVLPLVQQGFNLVLATALVHLYPPKHHTRALRLVSEVLDSDPQNSKALLGRAYIAQAASQWDVARNYFSRIQSVGEVALEAREGEAWAMIQLGEVQEGTDILREVIKAIDDDYLHLDIVRARIRWKLGKGLWDNRPDDDSVVSISNEAYTWFISALKCCASFAPAFTSLGIYYSEMKEVARASKCFQKAFELDPNEVEAAKRLAENFIEEEAWDLVEVIAKRVMEGEGGLTGRALGPDVGKGKQQVKNLWAWKALGVVEWNRSNWSAALQFFQVVVRHDPSDVDSWIQLGDANAKAGRHEAALKALRHAHEQKPDDWQCVYLIGDVQRQIGLYEEAIQNYRDVLGVRSKDSGALLALSETNFLLGQKEYSRGYFGRAESSFCEAIHWAVQMIHDATGFNRLAWKIIADALLNISRADIFADPVAVENAVRAIDSKTAAHAIPQAISELIPIPLGSSASMDNIRVQRLAVAAYSYRLSLAPKDPHVRGAASFDLAVSLHHLTLSLPPSPISDKLLAQSKHYVKVALGHDSGVAIFWDALGKLNFCDNPRIAQHAFISALEIEPKNASIWANLGLLYLYHEEVQLAKEAFSRAQILDPDYVMSWVGHSLVADQSGNNLEAWALLEHGTSLPTSIPQADLDYAWRTFERIVENKNMAATEALLTPFFTLERYLRQKPRDATALHLSALIAERIGKVEVACELVMRAIEILEEKYEQSEDPELERRYAVAHVNLGRLRLCNHDYQQCQEACETALSLIEPDSEETKCRVLRIHALLNSGLAHFFLQQYESAIQQLEDASQESETMDYIRSDVDVLLSRVLWVMGGEANARNAETRLLKCIESDPQCIPAITSLAAIGMLNSDEGLVDAALSEIIDLPLDVRRELDPSHTVDDILLRHSLREGDVAGALVVAQKEVLANPTEIAARKQLATVLLEAGKFQAAQTLLSNFEAKKADPEVVRETLFLEGIAKSRSEPQEAKAKMLEAIKTAPWNREAWLGLCYAQTL
ncbi:TPR-like protein [Sistotremastrum suecicum HHB10207 ss-3]|uniref:TPR-like protein n=1 Tax=Sistotremastrum suecicum HHB10207 ss-3 TaxID=1314776 RepID=A0A166G924_9AGAM|nr:TPR-like protein [Sistotremastrum suecicum HHB10207 ss-3]